MKKLKENMSKTKQNLVKEGLYYGYCSKEEIERRKKRAEMFSNSTDQVREYISNFIEEYMKENDVGFNEMVNILKSNATQLQKIRRGHANLKITSLAELAASLGCELEIKFKPQREYE